MTKLKLVILFLVTAIFVLWLVLNFSIVAGDENGRIRLVLGVSFFLLILFRRVPYSTVSVGLPSWVVPGVSVAGTLLVITGIVFGVRQFEWLGFVMVLFSSLCWAMPAKYFRNIALSLFVLYWIHPLPGRLFSKIQMAMQTLSVNGAEWLLHCLNVRVWADGVVLHTGFRTFLVPESCSGMVTVVTVMLCTLGAGILMRFRWREIVIFLPLGLFQILALNVIRISIMVVWSVRMPREWANNFLHDTLGIFLLAGIFLVQLEMSLWKKKKTEWVERDRLKAQGEFLPGRRGSMLPPFWKIVVRHGVSGVVFVALGCGMVFAVYKTRPDHRAAMIGDMVDDLSTHDIGLAEKAVNEAFMLTPYDRDLFSKRIRIMVLRGKYTEALVGLEGLKGRRQLGTEEIIMKSWSLMSLDRLNDAVVLIETLSESDKKLPGVAMLRAECAMRQDRPSVVASNVLLAASSPAMVNRIRNLYPYLAMHHQWEAVAGSDNTNVLYKDYQQALAAIYANLKLNDFHRAATILKTALTMWPNDSRFTESLLVVNSSMPGQEWEDLFAQNVSMNIDKMDSDRLVSCMEYCCRLGRYELACQLYMKLKAMDSDDPAINIAPVQFGDEWYCYWKKMTDAGETNTFTKLKAALRQPGGPAAYEKIRLKYLDAGLAELEKRRAVGKLSRRMYMAYPSALIMAGRYTEVDAIFDELQKKYPDVEKEITRQRADFYGKQSRWQDCYETLMGLCNLDVGIDFNVDLILINAMMNMNMGIPAMEVAERAQGKCPDLQEIRTMIAGIWDVFGFKDQALFVLSKNKDQVPIAGTVAQLLYDTSCFKESEKLCKTTGVKIVKRKGGKLQGLFPMPAERSLERGTFPSLSDEEMDREAEKLQIAVDKATSPYLRELWKLMIEWYKLRGQGDISNPNRWVAAGRCNFEKAGALHQLTMLLARTKKNTLAVRSAEEALKLLPQSAMLWRTLIGLTNGDTGVVRRAHTVCPADPEIWLAHLVVNARSRCDVQWIIEEVGKAAAEKRFSAGTMVRAGDFLLRNGLIEAACVAARDVTQRCNGYLPAYVLGLRCAITVKDMDWALICAMKGADNAVNPGPFYATIVDIKSLGRITDTDTVAMLEYLAEHFPREVYWAEWLGDIYFQKDDIRRSLNVFAPIIGDDLKNIGIRSILVASETARLNGECYKAIDILTRAYTNHPEAPEILNNLIYCLAQSGDQKNVAKAKYLLPKLAMFNQKSAAMFDTAAFVYLKDGDLIAARKYMDEALRLIDENDYSTTQIKLNAAEIMFGLGKYGESSSLLKNIRKRKDVSGAVQHGVLDLTTKINELQGEKR